MRQEHGAVGVKGDTGTRTAALTACTICSSTWRQSRRSLGLEEHERYPPTTSGTSSAVQSDLLDFEPKLTVLSLSQHNQPHASRINMSMLGPQLVATPLLHTQLGERSICNGTKGPQLEACQREVEVLSLLPGDSGSGPRIQAEAALVMWPRDST